MCRRALRCEMSRISFCLTLCVLLAPNAAVGTTFREEKEAGVTAHTHSIDDYGRPVRTTLSCYVFYSVETVAAWRGPECHYLPSQVAVCHTQ